MADQTHELQSRNKKGLDYHTTVVTYNTGEFLRVQGLKLEDWAE